jgi:hypothetical protein
MKKDPTIVLPDLDECGGTCFMCPFVRALGRMRRIQDIADDEKKLSRMAGSGDDISRAYAATLLVALAEKAPFFGRAFTPFGEALFAHRGKCKKDKLIGVQHFDDPSMRLVLVLDYVRGKKLHVYSLKDRMICTAKVADPPDEFVEYILDYLKVPLEGEGEVRTCHHIDEEDLEDPQRPILKIEWLSGATTIAFCQRCAKSSGNTFARFLDRMAIPKPRKDFDISVLGAIECKSNCEDCVLEVEALDPDTLEDYLTGKYGDAELIRKHLDGLKDFLKDKGDRIFVVGNRCFGTDRKAFMRALGAGPEERTAIKLILKKVDGPIIVEGETAAKLIQQYWKEHGEAVLRKLMGDRKLAQRTYKGADLNRRTVSQILKDAIVHVRKRDIISKLPEYKKLPAIAKFADKVARVYKSSGDVDAARMLERTLPDDTRVKAVAYALLKAMGREASKDWVFVETERDFANYLEEAARDLLKADPEDYHDSLQNLLAKTGSTEKIHPMEKKKDKKKKKKK